MSETIGLRLRREHVSDVSTYAPDSAWPGLTLEAWVRLAPLDNSARLYPLTAYDGRPYVLRAGQYATLAPDLLPQLGSVCLPEDVEIVLFSRPHFGGDVFAIRDDVPQVPDAYQTVGSAVVIDRGHRRQESVVLFASPGFGGAAQVLALPNTWQPGQWLAAAQSAWVPPGVALDITHDGQTVTYRGDLSQLPGGVRSITARREPEPEETAPAPTPGFVGIFSDDAGRGLTIERLAGTLVSSPDELRFGGEPLRPDRWYHLAQTWQPRDDDYEVRYFVNGRMVVARQWGNGAPGQPTSETLAGAGFGQTWWLGRGLRGSLAQVRVWKGARMPEEIRDCRFLSADGLPAAGASPAHDLFASGVAPFLSPPDAVAVAADLPPAPQAGALYQRMQLAVQSQQSASLLAAQQQATAQQSQASEQAQRKKARAREEARRQIHVQGISRLGFVRGEEEVIGTPKKGRINEATYVGNLRITDMVIDPTGRSYVALDGGYWHVRHFETNYTATPELPSPPVALTGDFSGTHPKALIKPWADLVPAVRRHGLYWIEADGHVCRAWIQPETDKPGERESLFRFAAPTGLPGHWDMTLDSERQRLFWTNGREIYICDVKAEPMLFFIHVPHAVAGVPVAVAAAPDGSLLWLDAAEEAVRLLPWHDGAWQFAAIKTLYQAPRPARGLAVCDLADSQNSNQETAFVYWVSVERRTLEAPVLDTPGQYIDFHHNPGQPSGQHVAVVPVDALTGAAWQTAGEAAYLKFFDEVDVVVFDPVRIDLALGWMAEADVIWEPGAAGASTPVCLYELATFEDEDRLVCAVEPGGLPVLHLRWNGHTLAAGRNVLSGKRLTANQRQRVAWLLDGHGRVSTWIDGVKVLEQSFIWPGGIQVFESHRLGAPSPEQEHAGIEGAQFGRSDDTRTAFAGFTGRLHQFSAWNGYVPHSEGDWSKRPPVDLSWARSLVTVDSRRRYLHAGRLDGQEPAVTLFPLDLDGGLTVETALDQQHAAVTLAHSRLAGAEAHAEQMKQNAVNQAQADLATAQDALTQTQARATADLDAAGVARDRQIEQARRQRADADATAQSTRQDGKQDERRIRQDAEDQATDHKTMAAAAANARVRDAQGESERVRGR